jgi:DNA polymerase III alpha subunit
MLTEHTIEELIKGVMRHGPDMLENCVANPDDIVQYLQRVDQERLNYPVTKLQVDKSNWFIPEEYRTMDILDWLYQQCPTPEIRERVVEELRLFAKHDMIPVLKTMKYVVDTLRKNNIVWGVGRGSSVASFVLFLLEIHRINSLYYDLSIDEFLK